MKILLVNKFHYLKGGSEKYYFELGQLLKEHGHEVAYFSMKDEKNIKTGDKEYFVEPIDLNNGSKFKALDIICSKQNYKKMMEAIDDFKPDIIHLNNFQRQLSASIVDAAYKRKIPMVFTAHDMQAICPAITMLDANGEICERCMHHNYINCYKKKCIKNSTLKSLLGTIENNYYYNKKIFENKINYIITPSYFYKNKFIENGISENKVIGIHNFIDINKYNIPIKDNNYILYLGRLSKEKGIINLINAIKINKKDNKNIKLFIAGDGPEKENIIDFIKVNNLEKNIKLLGFLNEKEVMKYVSECTFLVIPSIWYENGPYSVLETQLIGKAIIGAEIGGIPETVVNEKYGLTYKYDSIKDLSNKIDILWNDRMKCEKYGKNAKKYANQEYSSDKYYNELIKIYKSIVGEVK